MTHIVGSSDKHETKLVRHLGIVAGVCMESRLAELIAPHIKAEDLHDYSLGPALDAIYEYGITELFSAVAASVPTANGISTRFAHLDSTTFSLHGQYNSELDGDELEEGVIHITKGYSKDHAPELNQVVVQMICSHKSSLPVWIEALKR